MLEYIVVRGPHGQVGYREVVVRSCLNGVTIVIQRNLKFSHMSQDHLSFEVYISSEHKKYFLFTGSRRYCGYSWVETATLSISVENSYFVVNFLVT